MISDWYVVRVGAEGNSVIDFSFDFHEAYRKVDHLNQVYPNDEYQIVHESRLSEYFDIKDFSRPLDSSLTETEE